MGGGDAMVRSGGSGNEVRREGREKAAHDIKETGRVSMCSTNALHMYTVPNHELHLPRPLQAFSANSTPPPPPQCLLRPLETQTIKNTRRKRCKHTPKPT